MERKPNKGGIQVKVWGPQNFMIPSPNQMTSHAEKEGLVPRPSFARAVCTRIARARVGRQSRKIQMDCKTTFSIGAGVFTDEDFERAAKEVLDPDINGWEFFVESRGTKIYRNYKEESGLYEYKTFGVMADLDPEICAQVYVDWEYRKVWDTYVLDLRPIKDETTGMDGFYWCVDYPWPMWDRDYTFVRDLRTMEVGGVKTWVVLARSHKFSNLPEKEGVIRVEDFQQACVMQSDGNVGSRAFMYYYDNPKGMIPTWLINWAAKTGVPQFLDTMRKAVFGYKDFLEERRKALGVDELDNQDRIRQIYGLPPDTQGPP